VREFDALNRRGMKLHHGYFFASVNIPQEDILSRIGRARDHIPGIGRETALQVDDVLQLHVIWVRILRQHAGLWVELAFKSLHHGALESVEEHDQVLASAEQDVLAIGRELHRFDLFGFVFNRERLERLVLVVLGVEEVDHLVERLS